MSFARSLIDKHSLTIGAYFSYGWMPTILKNFNMDGDVTEALRVFNNVKNNQPIADDQEYMSLIRYVNNSMVGASKLLHFINPSQYPIFDSRIKNYFAKNELSLTLSADTYQNKSTDIQQYKIYREVCLKIINDTDFGEIYIDALNKLNLNHEITRMRVLENLFFYFGKK